MANVGSTPVVRWIEREGRERERGERERDREREEIKLAQGCKLNQGHQGHASVKLHHFNVQNYFRFAIYIIRSSGTVIWVSSATLTTYLRSPWAALQGHGVGQNSEPQGLTKGRRERERKKKEESRDLVLLYTEIPSRFLYT